MDWSSGDTPKRSKTSHGHRSSSSSSLPKRSQTPAFGHSSTRSNDRDKSYSGRKHHKKHKKSMDILEEDDEENGGASLGSAGQSSYSRRDTTSQASEDFRSLASHDYWTWSEKRQNWYHVDARGDVSWAPRTFA